MRKAILLPVAVGFAVSCYAQSFTSSPYSRFGLGEIQKSNFLQSKGMGGLIQGLRNPLSINFNNPASYSAITLTTFEIGAYTNMLRLSNATASQVNYNSSLSSIAFGFPIAKKWGGSFGLIPFSNVGYKVKETSALSNAGEVTSIYEGRGGLNQFYIGAAWKPFSRISAGVNVSYLFGSLLQVRSNEFNDTSAVFNIRVTNSTYVGDIYVNYGLQYIHPLSDDRTFTVGYSGSPVMELLARRTILAERYIGTDNVIDTLQDTPDEQSSVTLPPTHSLGFVLEKTNKWTFGADVYLNNWSEYRAFGENPSLNNSYGAAAGIQWIPDHNATGQFFKMIEYRGGLNYGRTFLNLKSTDINQYGLSLGFGLPLIKSNSKINLAFELGQRGTTSNNLIREQYLNIHIGFTYNDKWFIKRRYD